MTSRFAFRSLIGLCVGLAYALAPPRVEAQGDPPAAPCGGWQVDYTLSGSLQLADTTLGQGDGTYAVGPGSMTIRFDDVDSKPGGRASLVSYEMREAFKVFSRTLFWATTVTTNTSSRAVGVDACGAPQGLLGGTTLAWSLPVPGVRTDGTLFCEGSFCGKFGAPPPGSSEIHIPAHPTTFKSFQFSADMQTFTMRSMFVSKTEAPMQTAHLALSGRELRRACVPVAKPCP